MRNPRLLSIFLFLSLSLLLTSCRFDNSTVSSPTLRDAVEESLANDDLPLMTAHIGDENTEIDSYFDAVQGYIGPTTIENTDESLQFTITDVDLDYMFAGQGVTISELLLLQLLEGSKPAGLETIVFRFDIEELLVEWTFNVENIDWERTEAEGIDILND